MPIYIHPKNILETSTVTHSGTDYSGNPVERVYDRSIDFLWSTANVGNAWVKADQGSDSDDWVDVQFCYIANHNFSGLTVTLQYSSNDADWSNADSETATDDDIVFSLSSAMSYRYWRVYAASTVIDPKAGEIWIGNTIEVPIMKSSSPVRGYAENVSWTTTVGGGARSTRNGKARRVRSYTSQLRGDYLDDFEGMLSNNDLYDFSYPFFITDHKSNTFFAQFTSIPSLTDIADADMSMVNINLLEVL